MNNSARFLAPLLSIVLLAGCETERAPEPAEVAAQGVPPAVKVKTTVQRHVVYVSGGKSGLSETERLGLADFISDSSGGATDSTHIRIRGTVPADRLAPLTQAIIRDGISPSKIEIEAVPASDLGVGAGSALGQPVEIVASVSRVAYPSCPRHSWTSIVGDDNPPSSNYGCSFVTNLEAEVDDPRDLVQGEGGGVTDAQLTNAAIERLRTDKTRKLSNLSTSSAVSAGGGGQ